jgi:predicted ATPase
MLTSLQIKNFKAWKDTGRVRLAPLTVIFGANSAGKSSLGHLLLALKQTAESTDRKRSLHLGDSNSFVDLGTFKDCIHDHDLKAALEFEMAWTTPHALSVKDPLEKGRTYDGDRMTLEISLAADELEQPEVGRIAFSLHDDQRGS